jgi:predicted ester cyclase
MEAYSMNKIDIVRSVIIDGSSTDTSAFYSDDFQATDSVGGQPMDKRAWLAMTPLMRASFPDIGYVIEDIREEGEKVRLTGHFVGTFTNDLDLSALGVGVISASGKKITWPTSSGLITVKGDRITRWQDTDTGPDAGFSGFLKAIGAG